MTGGTFNPKRVLDDVIFGAPMDDVNDDVEDSRAIEAAKESEMA